MSNASRSNGPATRVEQRQQSLRTRRETRSSNFPNTSNEVLLLVTSEQAPAFVGRDSQGHGLIAEPIRKCSPGEYAMSAKAEWPFQLVSTPLRAARHPRQPAPHTSKVFSKQYKSVASYDFFEIGCSSRCAILVCNYPKPVRSFGCALSAPMCLD